MHIYRTEKILLECTGEVKKLLHGITTQTEDAPRTAFIDVYSRIIAVADQWHENDKTYLIIEKSTAQKLFNHLKPYLKLTGVEIRQLKHVIYWNVEQDYKESQNENQKKVEHKEKGEKQERKGAQKEQEWIIKQKAGELICTTTELKKCIPEETFNAFRLEHNIPVQGIDYTNEPILNVDPTLVSFKKGCFLGQEVVARIDSRTKPPKKLVVQCTSDPEKSKSYTSVIQKKDSEWCGFTFVKNE